MKILLKSVVSFIAVAATALAITSCNNVKPIGQAQLDGFWVLKTMNGQDAKTLFLGTLPTIEFNFADSLVSGNAGCNNYFGKFTLNEKNEFSAPQLGMTMMLCPEQNAEGEFAKALGEKSVISIDTAGLLTFTQNRKVVLQFERGEKPVLSSNVQTATPDLIAGSWNLKTMAGEDIVFLFADKIPTVEFDTQGGQVSGLAGCNRYNATYTLENGVLTFGPVVRTKMACPSLDGETKFIKTFETPCQASVNDGELTLSKDSAVVLIFSRTRNQIE